jgi:hypothetical protein
VDLKYKLEHVFLFYDLCCSGHIFKAIHINYHKEYHPAETIVHNFLQVTEASTELNHRTVLMMARGGSIFPDPEHYTKEDLIKSCSGGSCS